MSGVEIIIALIVVAIVATLVTAGASLWLQIKLWRRERRELLMRWIRQYLHGVLHRDVQ